MPVSYCRACNHWIDMDGFVEHGFATLWYCHCMRIFAVRGLAPVAEVPRDECDLEPNEWGTPRPGVWINARRWNRLKHLADLAPVTADLPNGDQRVVYSAYHDAIDTLQGPALSDGPTYAPGTTSCG